MMPLCTWRLAPLDRVLFAHLKFSFCILDYRAKAWGVVYLGNSIL